MRRVNEPQYEAQEYTGQSDTRLEKKKREGEECNTLTPQKGLHFQLRLNVYGTFSTDKQHPPPPPTTTKKKDNKRQKNKEKHNKTNTQTKQKSEYSFPSQSWKFFRIQIAAHCVKSCMILSLFMTA